MLDPVALVDTQEVAGSIPARPTSRTGRSRPVLCVLGDLPPQPGRGWVRASAVHVGTSSGWGPRPLRRWSCWIPIATRADGA